MCGERERDRDKDRNRERRNERERERERERDFQRTKVKMSIDYLTSCLAPFSYQNQKDDHKQMNTIGKYTRKSQALDSSQH
jgi:hypothetical protein